MKIVYMGTPEFAVPPLMELNQSSHEILCVVTQPDRIKGRGKKLLPSPVKEKALEYGIKVLQPDKVKGNEEFINELRELNPEVIVVAAYGRILPKEILELPQYGCINIHASLLPRWRGAAPMQHAILSGDEKSGVTIMQMAEGLDTGDMLAWDEVSLMGEAGPLYYPTLSDKLSQMGGPLLIKVLEQIGRGEANPIPQDDSKSTYAGMIKKEDGKIVFAEKTSFEIERMIRAYEPWPGAYCYMNGELLKFKGGKAIGDEEYVMPEPKEDLDKITPGRVLQADNTGIFIKCKEGVFQLTELQIPGKNWMDSASYLRGHNLELGTVLE